MTTSTQKLHARRSNVSKGKKAASGSGKAGNGKLKLSEKQKKQVMQKVKPSPKGHGRKTKQTLKGHQDAEEAELKHHKTKSPGKSPGSRGKTAAPRAQRTSGAKAKQVARRSAPAGKKK